jgi:hypothetical protein
MPNQLAGLRLGAPGVHGPKPGDEFQIFHWVELVVNHRLVGHPGHHRFGFDRRRARVDTANANLAGIRLQQAGDHAERRGFSGAVRSKQRVKLSAMNGQR